MDENRKQTIIKEITYWKKNRLLPDHYCDFLLALYTEGKGIQENKIQLSRRKKAYFLFLLVPVIIFFIYFTELSLILQITFGIILILLGISMTVYLSKKGLLFHIPLMVSAVILLFVSVEFTLKRFPENVFSLYAVLLVNCFIWFFSGWKFKLTYFSISGVLGILLLVVSLFLNR